MTGEGPVRVVLGGAYPLPGTPPGTWGRVLGSVLDSVVLEGEVQFIKYRKTLPVAGGPVRRILLDIGRFWRCLRPRPDILHLHVVFRDSTYREFLVLEMARWLGIKTICDVRTGGLQYHMAQTHNGLQNRMLDHMFRSADGLLVECRGDCEFIQRRIGRLPGFHPNVMLHQVFDRVVPARLPPAPGEPLKLVFTGRFIREKGIHTMLDGLELLSRRRRAVELHLVGEGDDAALNDRIRRVLENPPPGTKLVDHGWMDRTVLDVLCQSHVFTMLTDWPSEGHSYSVLEAMTCGLGLILSDWPNLSLIAPMQHTKTVSPTDAEGFARAVEEFLDHPEQLAEAGCAARRFVADHFLDSAIRRELLDLYRRLAQ